MSVNTNRILHIVVAALWVALIVGGTGRSAAAAASSSLLKDPFFGIAPQDEHYYKSSSDIIQCKDGSKKFTRAQLNDDFCDCPDGTDEPGTSACPSGKFYCRNVGYVPTLLFSSRVNDQICDCCDGSDEYDGSVKCQNTCWEAGKVARDKLKKKIAMYQEGAALRKHELEKAKIAVAKDEAELLQLKKEEKILKGLVQQLKEHKEQIDKVEEKERLQKENEEKEKKEAEEARQVKVDIDEEPTESSHGDKIVEDSSPNQDMAGDYDDSATKVEQSDDTSGAEGSHLNDKLEHTTEDEVPERKEETKIMSDSGPDTTSEVSSDQLTKQGNDVSENNEGISREELGRLVASRWTGENSEKQKREVDHAKNDDHEDHDEIPKDLHEEEYEGYASGTDEEDSRYDDENEDDAIEEDFEDEGHDDSSSSYTSDTSDEPDVSDITTSSNPSWLEKIQQTVRKILHAVNFFQTPVDKSEYAYIRKEYDESSAKLSKLQSRISSLSQKLKHDFGPDKEFYSFHDHCFESKQNKYVYKVCPFKQASQEEGHSTTRLGRWDKFEDSYRVMMFSNGDKCWNGPDRSLKVKLRCGLKNEVTDVDEPSRCEYVAVLSTPTLCQEERLKELQHKLDLMEKQQPRSHDEL